MNRWSHLLRRAGALGCLVAGLTSAQGAEPLLLRHPSLSQDRIAFLYADDVWTVSREGGEARRLTSVGGVNGGPYLLSRWRADCVFRPIAALTDVYVIDAHGGVPRRLTWEPTGNSRGRLDAGRQECSVRLAHASNSVFPRLFRMHADGTGTPAECCRCRARTEGTFSADGNTLAYVPVASGSAWKHYRGGQTTPVWLVNMKTLDLEKIPRESSNDSSPVWEGATVYFLSDRNGPVSLFSYDTGSKRWHSGRESWLRPENVAAGPGALVYEQFGSLHLYDWPRARSARYRIPSMATCLAAPHLGKLPPGKCENFSLSPTGVRIVVEAHGDIFTLPAEKGDIRNLTKTPGSAERDPGWSPDGKSLAYFSDASGEYQLYIRDQDGLQPPKVIDLGPDPSFFYGPRWSPDSKRIAFSDKHLHLWYVDAAGGKPVKIDTGLRGSFGPSTELSWSPDSQWIAYTRDLENELHAVFFYSLATHASTQITDGMSNAAHPVFDPGGKYLYFTASTNNGPSDAGIDLSSLDRATNSSAYVVVLAKDGASPVPPESDDENKKKEDDKDKEDKDKKDADKKDDCQGRRG